MPDNMIEAKLDSFQKLQENLTKVGFKIQHSDIPDYLAAAALGKRYYLVFVDADDYDEREGRSIVTKPETNCDKTEGEKLRIRAVMLCEDRNFQIYVSKSTIHHETWLADNVQGATRYIYECCRIKSRSEIATDIVAQNKFKELLEDFKSWQTEQQYSENLGRM